jgi:hypothetical protein
MSLGSPASRTDVWSGLPAYPGRIAPTPDGALWLSMFAMRTHLVEFVLREDAFRAEMVETIDPELWIRPSLKTPRSGDVPLQAGNVKALGVVKPWGPPRSYGLAVRATADLRPLTSLHSRVGGDVHGIVATQADATRSYFLSAALRGVVVDG